VISSFGELVEIRVNGEEPQQVQIGNRVARFEQVTLPLTGEVKLTAFAGGSNGLIEEEITVTVNASACELSLTPEPMEGCDLGGSADLDPDASGLQVELSAASSCESVAWTVNGRAYDEVEVVEGQARLNVTLNQGENTVSAQAQSANGLAAEVETYVLDVDLSDPNLSIDGFEEIGVNRRGAGDVIESIDAEGTVAYSWEISGFTSDLSPGTRAQVVFEPALEGARARSRLTLKVASL